MPLRFIGNKNTKQTFEPITEAADIIIPVLQAATIDLNDGAVVINASETVDLTPLAAKINLTRLSFANVTRDNEINLFGATVVGKMLCKYLTLTSNSACVL